MKKVSRQSEWVRLELLSKQHALCLPFLFEDALLDIPDGDGYALVSITLDPTHHGFTPLFDFLTLRFPSPTPTPITTCEDDKSAPRPHTPRSQAGTPSPVPAAPRSTALHRHKNTCIQAPTMNQRFSPLATDRRMLHLPLCAPTNRPIRYGPTTFPAQ
jgi:hypothetical protein